MKKNARFTGALTREVIGGAVILGIIGGIAIDLLETPYLYEYVEASESELVIEPEPKEVRIEVVYNWNAQRIEQEIREIFHEMPNTAVATFKCESGGGVLKAQVQSGHILSYGQEQSFGPLQIHAPDHEQTAQRLGYGDYRTNPASNVRLGKYIYDQRIKHGGYPFQDWSCYKQDLYKKYL